MQPETAQSPTDLFVRVLRGLLRPLVRVLIARGVTAPVTCGLLKEVYVRVADEDFRLAGKRPTDSRVSILTGIHRRDVHALRQDGPDAGDAVRGKTTLLATIIGQWLAGPDTLDAAGQPRPLPRSGDDGPNFEQLVRAVNRDVRPRTVLDELLRQGVVRETLDGLLHLVADVVVGPADAGQKTIFFAANVGDHMAAAAENLIAAQPRFLERAVFYNRLLPGSVDRIEARARALGQAALVELNALAKDHQGRDAGQAQALQRFRFGVYLYREDENSPEMPNPDQPEPDETDRLSDRRPPP